MNNAKGSNIPNNVASNNGPYNSFSTMLKQIPKPVPKKFEDFKKVRTIKPSMTINKQTIPHPSAQAQGANSGKIFQYSRYPTQDYIGHLSASEILTVPPVKVADLTVIGNVPPNPETHINNDLSPNRRAKSANAFMKSSGKKLEYSEPDRFQTQSSAFPELDSQKPQEIPSRSMGFQAPDSRIDNYPAAKQKYPIQRPKSVISFRADTIFENTKFKDPNAPNPLVAQILEKKRSTTPTHLRQRMKPATQQTNSKKLPGFLHISKPIMVIRSPFQFSTPQYASFSKQKDPQKKTSPSTNMPMAAGILSSIANEISPNLSIEKIEANDRREIQFSMPMQHSPHKPNASAAALSPATPASPRNDNSLTPFSQDEKTGNLEPSSKFEPLPVETPEISSSVAPGQAVDKNDAKPEEPKNKQQDIEIQPSFSATEPSISQQGDKSQETNKDSLEIPQDKIQQHVDSNQQEKVSLSKRKNKAYLSIKKRKTDENESLLEKVMFEENGSGQFSPQDQADGIAVTSETEFFMSPMSNSLNNGRKSVDGNSNKRWAAGFVSSAVKPKNSEKMEKLLHLSKAIDECNQTKISRNNTPTEEEPKLKKKGSKNDIYGAVPKSQTPKHYFSTHLPPPPRPLTKRPNSANSLLSESPKASPKLKQNDQFVLGNRDSYFINEAQEIIDQEISNINNNAHSAARIATTNLEFSQLPSNSNYFSRNDGSSSGSSALDFEDPARPFVRTTLSKFQVPSDEEENNEKKQSKNDPNAGSVSSNSPTHKRPNSQQSVFRNAPGSPTHGETAKVDLENEIRVNLHAALKLIKHSSVTNRLKGYEYLLQNIEKYGYDAQEIIRHGRVLSYILNIYQKIDLNNIYNFYRKNKNIVVEFQKYSSKFDMLQEVEAETKEFLQLTQIMGKICLNNPKNKQFFNNSKGFMKIIQSFNLLMIPVFRTFHILLLKVMNQIFYQDFTHQIEFFLQGGLEMIFSILDMPQDNSEDPIVAMSWQIQHLKAKIISLKCLAVVLSQNSSNVQKFIDKKGMVKIIHLLMDQKPTSPNSNRSPSPNSFSPKGKKAAPIIDFSKSDASVAALNQITNSNNLKYRRFKETADFSSIVPFFSVDDFSKIDSKILNWLPQYFQRESVALEQKDDPEKKIIEVRFWLWVLKQETITFIGDLTGVSNQIRFQILDLNALSLFFDFWKCHTRTFFEFQKFLSLVSNDAERKSKKKFFPLTSCVEITKAIGSLLDGHIQNQNEFFQARGIEFLLMLLALPTISFFEYENRVDIKFFSEKVAKKLTNLQDLLQISIEDETLEYFERLWTSFFPGSEKDSLSIIPSLCRNFSIFKKSKIVSKCYKIHSKFLQRLLVCLTSALLHNKERILDFLQFEDGIGISVLIDHLIVENLQPFLVTDESGKTLPLSENPITEIHSAAMSICLLCQDCKYFQPYCAHAIYPLSEFLQMQQKKYTLCYSLNNNANSNGIRSLTSPLSPITPAKTPSSTTSANSSNINSNSAFGNEDFSLASPFLLLSLTKCLYYIVKKCIPNIETFGKAVGAHRSWDEFLDTTIPVLEDKLIGNLSHKKSSGSSSPQHRRAKSVNGNQPEHVQDEDSSVNMEHLNDIRQLKKYTASLLNEIKL